MTSETQAPLSCSRLPQVLGLLLAAGLSGGPAGCGGGTPHTVDITPADLPHARLSDDGRTWESTPWVGGPWLGYPATASLVLFHGLGRAPMHVTVYLSMAFDQGCQDVRSAVPAAGDLVRISDVSESTVRISNDTNGDYCVRVVLR
ncbi:MAG: hypothetical protein MJD61_10860 [Proteobacteria bacterium]|nr:hypothetical protein [Pseudomonadota bacterium]